MAPVKEIATGLSALVRSGAFGEDDRCPFMRTEQALKPLDAVLREYTAWVVLPKRVDTASSALSGLVRRCRELTGWSGRELAQVLGTSHTTVRMFESEGRATARSRSVAAKLNPLLGVLSRLDRVAGNRSDLALALSTPNDRGVTAMDLLSEQAWAKAFVTGLDVLKGPRQEMLAPDDTWAGPSGTREMR